MEAERSQVRGQSGLHTEILSKKEKEKTIIETWKNLNQSDYLLFFGGTGVCTCKAGPLLLEPHL
jgi:hypothetical protein